ncbi:uncharacterized protein ACA1_036940 [Acanthamoeba castellanii str. Neff]|uniref:PHD-type domain-containing protein n=1 Tax=Acanthamoeba castellanii (strain ATCC 30010 / Neff) TaxID=1257118 RepID=L8H0T3_ACACF|nr:uncharacterized protein ACA1_036940 [Acanthamoeba castellanii str. Neff]ELR18860.1 hypothetical protein ACA1_036940 [Acanthamoeba castellanii str. Neff]
MEQVEAGTHAQGTTGGSRGQRRGGGNRVRYTEKVFVPKQRNPNQQPTSAVDPFASNAPFDNPLDFLPLPPPHVIDPSIQAELQATGSTQQASRRNENGRGIRGPRRGGQERSAAEGAPPRGRRDGQRTNQRSRGRRDSPPQEVVIDSHLPPHEPEAGGSEAVAAAPARGNARGGERRDEARRNGNERQDARDRNQRGERRNERGQQQRGGRSQQKEHRHHHDNYAHAHARVATTAAHGEMTDLAEELLAGLLNDSYECMICMNNVRRRQSIWHCEECYALFHLDCISKWSKNSLEEARQVPQGILPQKPPADGWRCPHCNKTHRQHEGPPVSRCFCGKYANPEFNPYITPHSCGDLCGRMRAGTDCPHPCNFDGSGEVLLVRKRGVSHPVRRNRSRPKLRRAVRPAAKLPEAQVRGALPSWAVPEVHQATSDEMLLRQDRGGAYVRHRGRGQGERRDATLHVRLHLRPEASLRQPHLPARLPYRSLRRVRAAAQARQEVRVRQDRHLVPRRPAYQLPRPDPHVHEEVREEAPLRRSLVHQELPRWRLSALQGDRRHAMSLQAQHQADPLPASLPAQRHGLYRQGAGALRRGLLRHSLLRPTSLQHQVLYGGR